VTLVAFPLIAALVALACACFLGWRGIRHPRPESVVWTVAFAVFALAAGAEVVGTAIGWSGPLVRIYYVTGAVLVVGILALGELYLLFPRRVPAIAPGLAILTSAVALTAVWNAPIDQTRLQTEGWNALIRDLFLVALTVAINAGGTLVLVAGTLYSAWRIYASGGSRQRALGCALIAGGAIVVAMGGTLTRFGHREYLYLAMALGVAIIFGGVVLASSTRRRSDSDVLDRRQDGEIRFEQTPITALPPLARRDLVSRDEAVRYVVDHMLPLEETALAAACRRWSATPADVEDLTREQAKQVWALRLALPAEDRARFDLISPQVQAQLAELYVEIWSNVPAVS
jgi:hypothetical protein